MLIEKPPVSIAIRFWWSYTWRAMLAVIPIAFLVGFVGHFFGLSSYPTARQLLITVLVIPFVIGALHRSFGRRFGSYMVCVVAAETPSEPKSGS